MPFDGSDWPPRDPPPKRPVTFWDLFLLSLQLYLAGWGVVLGVRAN